MKRIKRYYKKFLNIIKKPEMSILPGQLAFFVVLSVVPVITIIAYAASLFNLPMSFISDFFDKAFGTEIVSMISPMIDAGSQVDFQFFVFLIIAFYIASNGARSIIIAANSIYKIRSNNIIKNRVKSIMMTLIIVILVVFILVVPVFGNKIVDLILYMDINKNISLKIISILRILKGPVSWFVMFVLLKFIYTMAPDKKIASANVTYGSLFTTFGWGIATAIYSFYISNYASNYQLIYAGLSNIVILMLWLYILTTIFVWGLAINSNTENELELAKNAGIKKEQK